MATERFFFIGVFHTSPIPPRPTAPPLAESSEQKSPPRVYTVNIKKTGLLVPSLCDSLSSPPRRSLVTSTVLPRVRGEGGKKMHFCQKKSYKVIPVAKPTLGKKIPEEG